MVRSIPAWANGLGSWGICKGRAEGPVHSEVGRTFRPPPGGRRFPGALPQALTGPRRWRSDRPAAGSTRHATTADPPRAERTTHLADLPSALRPPHSGLLRFLLQKAFRVFRVFRGPPSALRVFRDGSLDPAPVRDGSSPASSGSALRDLVCSTQW